MFTKLVTKFIKKKNPLAALNFEAMNHLTYKIRDLDKAYKSQIKRCYQKYGSESQSEFRERVDAIVEEWYDKKAPLILHLTLLRSMPWTASNISDAIDKLSAERYIGLQNHRKESPPFKHILYSSDDADEQRRYNLHNNKLHMKDAVWQSNDEMLDLVLEIIRSYPELNHEKNYALSQIAFAYYKCAEIIKDPRAHHDRGAFVIAHHDLKDLYIEAATNLYFSFHQTDKKVGDIFDALRKATGK